MARACKGTQSHMTFPANSAFSGLTAFHTLRAVMTFVENATSLRHFPISHAHAHNGRGNGNSSVRVGSGVNPTRGLLAQLVGAACG
jgi:hypothetical protein